MIGRLSVEFSSNGSSMGAVCIAGGCTGRRGREGGRGLVELIKR
jgi:hypothetical protein